MEKPQEVAVTNRIQEELSRLEESAKYSAQGQFEMAKRWRLVHTLLGVATAVITAIAASLTFAGNHLAVLAGVLGMTGAVGAAVLTALSPQGRAERAQTSANGYLSIQTAARQVRLIDSQSESREQLRRSLARLTKRRDEVNEAAAPISRWAYEKAKSNIDGGGQTYQADSEPGK